MTVEQVKDLDIERDQSLGENEERRVCNWVGQMLIRAKQAREPTLARMKKNLGMYTGEGHWEHPMPSYRAKLVDNRCFGNVESALPIIMDNRPKADLVPGHPDDKEIVEELKAVYDAKWDDLELEMLSTLAVKDALARSEGYLKLWFDPTLKNGMGDLMVELVEPTHMYPDPDSMHPLLKDAYYVIYHAPRSLSVLRSLYPEKSGQLNKLYQRTYEPRDDERNEEDKGDIGPGQTAHDAGDTPGAAYWSRSEAYTGSEKLWVTELWVDDQTIRKEIPDFAVLLEGGAPVELSEGVEEQLIQQGATYEIVPGDHLEDVNDEYENVVRWRRKYPNGRIIVTCGDVLLEDKSSPYQHGRCPYVRFFRYTVPGKNYFFSEIDQIIPLNLELNKRKSQSVDLLTLTSNPPIIVNTASGLDIKNMTNRPGGIWPVHVDVDRAVKWLQVPNIPSALFVQIEQINKDIDTVSGIHDVTQGRKPTGITAGIAIETLQEAAQTRLRLAARYLEFSLKHLAELMISVIWEYYKEDRIIRRKGKNGEWEFKHVNFFNTELHGGMPQVVVKPGSTMIVNKSAQKQQALILFQNGALDQEAILEIFEIEGREEIIRRMRAEAQEMAQMEAAKGAGQAG